MLSGFAVRQRRGWLTEVVVVVVLLFFRTFPLRLLNWTNGQQLCFCNCPKLSFFSTTYYCCYSWMASLLPMVGGVEDWHWRRTRSRIVFSNIKTAVLRGGVGQLIKQSSPGNWPKLLWPRGRILEWLSPFSTHLFQFTTHLTKSVVVFIAALVRMIWSIVVHVRLQPPIKFFLVADWI